MPSALRWLFAPVMLHLDLRGDCDSVCCLYKRREVGSLFALALLQLHTPVSNSSATRGFRSPRILADLGAKEADTVFHLSLIHI